MYHIMLLLGATTPSEPVGPKPIGDPARWITNDDYPSQAASEEQEGTVVIEVTIDETGHAARCRIVMRSGTALLDQTACAAVARRGMWEPSLDDAGQPVFAVYKRRITWRLNYSNETPQPLPADMEIDVAKLPITRAEAKVVVRQVQRADGSEESCSVAVPSPSPALNKIACGVAKPLTQLDPIANVRGERVRGVRWRTIQFTDAAGAAQAK